MDDCRLSSMSWHLLPESVICCLGHCRSWQKRLDVASHVASRDQETPCVYEAC